MTGKTGRGPAHEYLEPVTVNAINLAFATDFVSASHFPTCYRQLHGKTPRAERAAIA